MTKTFYLVSMVTISLLLFSCKKTNTEDIVNKREVITINTSDTNIIEGSTLSFFVQSSINNDVTAASKIYVNDSLIADSSFKFNKTGKYSVYAKKDTIKSNVINIVVVEKGFLGFSHNVLVEEFSGTWCGNCPSILFGVDSLHKLTTKACVVGIHLFNNDPFITNQGNSLATNLNVSGVPTGLINRTINWTAPHYQNVKQITSQIKSAENLGLAIASTVNNTTVTANVKVAFKQALTGNYKLHIYIVEDKLYYTQRNYSATLYGGQAYIPNFEYNGVLKAVISNLSGDAITTTGATVEKTYSILWGSKINNINNARLVAFVTDATGRVINTQQVKAGSTVNFEKM